MDGQPNGGRASLCIERKTAMELLAWQGAQRPERVTLEGRYARLEPLSLAAHGEQLFASALEPGADDRFR